MTATTYYAMTADEQLAAAQRTLDTHITSSATGRCLACGSYGPCYKRENAVVIFSRTFGCRAVCRARRARSWSALAR